LFGKQFTLPHDSGSAVEHLSRPQMKCDLYSGQYIFSFSKPKLYCATCTRRQVYILC